MDSVSIRYAARRSESWAAIALLCLATIASPALAQESSSTTTVAETLTIETPTSPVIVDGKALFSVRGISAYSANKRASDIANQIRLAAANRNLAVSALTLSETADATRIVAGDRTIMTVVDADGVLEGVEREVLAKVLLRRITEAVATYRADREPAVMSRHALRALAATLALLVAILLARRAIGHAHSWFEARYRGKVRDVGIQSFQFIRAEQIWGIVRGVINLVWVAGLLIALYFYLEYVLSLFPWTRGLANDLFLMLANPLSTMGWGVLRLLPDVVFLVILVVVARYVLALIRLFFDALENGTIALPNFDPTWAKPTYRLARVAVIIFALVVAYPYIPGSDSQAFKGVSLFVGVLFSLGSTSLIGNIVAGYTLTYRRTFKKGDRVRIGQYLGDIEQSRLMATYLRTPKNELVVVPNSKIINEEVLNYSTLAKEKGLILHTTVGIGYEAPWRQVEAMLLEAAARTPGIFRNPKPYVLQKELATFSVVYELNAYCDQPNVMGRLYTQLHRNILDLFNEYGVQIMTPAYEGDPETLKVVPRDRWHAAPARPPLSGQTSQPTEAVINDDPDVPQIPKAS